MQSNLAVSPIKASLGLIVTSLGASLACFILLYLAQFSEFGPPPNQLPLEVIAFLGSLFTGFVFPFLKRLKEPALAISMALAGLLSLGASYGLSLFSFVSPVTGQALSGSLLYVIAPLIALVLAYALNSTFPKRASLYVAMLVYIVCTILANYTLDSFIPVPISLPEWLPLSFEGKLNVGTLFFGITFTQRDHIHQFGRKYAYITILIAAFANVGVALRLMTPLRFVLVSFIAIVLSETADTEVYQRFINRSWLNRVASSNAISIPIDSIIFTVFAFYGAAFATPQWMTEVILTDIIIKFLVGFITALGIWQFRPKAVHQPAST